MLEIDRPWHKGKRQSPYRENERKRKIRRWTITMVILILLFFLLGFIYTWYMGQKPVDGAITAAPKPAAPQQLKKPIVSDELPVGIVQQSLTSPITPPVNAAISIKTNPLAACSIVVKLNNVESKDTGLAPKDADEFGLVTWTWSVPAGVLVGKVPVDIHCANKKNSAYFHADLVVSPPQ